MLSNEVIVAGFSYVNQENLNRTLHTEEELSKSLYSNVNAVQVIKQIQSVGDVTYQPSTAEKLAIYSHKLIDDYEYFKSKAMTSNIDFFSKLKEAGALNLAEYFLITETDFFIDKRTRTAFRFTSLHLEEYPDLIFDKVLDVSRFQILVST